MVSSGLRRLAAPLRAALVLVVLLLAPTFAGCTRGPTAPAPETPALQLVAIDGRWPFDLQRALLALASVGFPEPAGALVMGEAMGARAVGDVVGMDQAAASSLGVGLPQRGEALVTRSWALREGVGVGDPLTLRSGSHPPPYVATYFEMERTRPCEATNEAKLCFLPTLLDGEARLRLRVDTNARDLGLLPDLVELGPGARPAFWNGTFTSPSGVESPLLAHALTEGDLVVAETTGILEAGNWSIGFRLEAGGRAAPTGAAGIVRVREPGYLWFDDRLQNEPTPERQARAVLANETSTRLEVRIAGLLDAAPLASDIMLSIDDARTLAGTADVTGLLVNVTPSQAKALGDRRSYDGMTGALRARPLPHARAYSASSGDLVFAAPANVSLASLPPIEGARAPSLALAARAAVGEPATIDAEPTSDTLLLLAHADGPLPWTLPEGGRWTQTSDALENLSRSRTLALASGDLLLAPIATARVQIGEGNTSRSIVAIGGVTGGPDQTLWTSAALVAGAAKPALARVVLPLAPSADRAEVAQRALEAWAPFGLALDR